MAPRAGESKLIEKEVQEATKDVEDQQGELERHLGKSAEVRAAVRAGVNHPSC